MKINYYLKSLVRKTMQGKPQDETYVELRARYNGNLLIFNTGVKVKPKLWDKKKQRIKAQSIDQSGNSYLDFLVTELTRLYRENLIEGKVLAPGDLRVQLKSQLQRNSRTEKSLLDYFKNDFIEAKSKLSTHKERVVESTVARYKVVIKHLEAYQAYRNTKLTFMAINKAFYNDFVHFLSKKYTFVYNKEEVTGLEDNTIGNTVKFLKTFLKWAQEEGFHSNDEYRKFKVFKVQDEVIITLSEEELKKIKDVDLTGNQRLQKVRDIFLAGVEIGARVSDLLELTDRNLVKHESGSYSIKYQPKKTLKHKTKPLSIPIRQEIVSIFRKYEGQYDTLLPVISEVKLNEYLKELAQLAKINTLHEVTKTKDGTKKVIERVEKWKVISSHVMRRTFITQALKAGMVPQLVMDCSGHSDYRSFQRYIDMSDEGFKNRAFEEIWKRSEI